MIEFKKIFSEMSKTFICNSTVFALKVTYLKRSFIRLKKTSLNNSEHCNIFIVSYNRND